MYYYYYHCCHYYYYYDYYVYYVLLCFIIIIIIEPDVARPVARHLRRQRLAPREDDAQARHVLSYFATCQCYNMLLNFAHIFP